MRGLVSVISGPLFCSYGSLPKVGKLLGRDSSKETSALVTTLLVKRGSIVVSDLLRVKTGDCSSSSGLSGLFYLRFVCLRSANPVSYLVQQCSAPMFARV